VVAGNAFSDSDVRSATRVALIGKTAAQNLFGDEDPVGKTIRIRQSPFVILGVLGLKGQGMDGRDQDDTIIIPLTTAQRPGVRQPVPRLGAHDDGANQHAGDHARRGKEMTALLRQRHRTREGMDNDFSLAQPDRRGRFRAESTRVMSMLLGGHRLGVAAGRRHRHHEHHAGVGHERTREIGIRMAIGARERDILTQFLLEPSSSRWSAVSSACCWASRLPAGRGFDRHAGHHRFSIR